LPFDPPPLTPCRYMYAEGMKLAKRFEEEEAELADKLKVCGAGGQGGTCVGQGCLPVVALWGLLGRPSGRLAGRAMLRLAVSGSRWTPL
jgi:hypothetical protein